MTNPTPKHKSWQRPLRGFFKEILLPIGMALVVIQFVIQAFKIPTGSMEDTLLVGDFLLGLKFIYGSPIPFTNEKLPALASPKPGDILIFRYPGDPRYPQNDAERYQFVANLFLFGNVYWDTQAPPGKKRLVWYAPRDFIKRCVAQSGQSVRVRRKKLVVDGEDIPLPPRGKHFSGLPYHGIRDSLDFFLPPPGTQYRFDSLSLTQAAWIRSLAMQENPGDAIRLHLDLYVDSVLSNSEVLPEVYLPYHPVSEEIFRMLGVQWEQSLRWAQSTLVTRNLPFAAMQRVAETGFIRLDEGEYSPGPSSKRVENYAYFLGKYLETLERSIAEFARLQGSEIQIRASLRVNGEKRQTYTTRYPCYLMMGDNRDNSSDGRFWGLLSQKNVKAKAFIIYLSLENRDHALRFGNPLSWALLPFRLRWSRVGKLIE